MLIRLLIVPWRTRSAWRREEKIGRLGRNLLTFFHDATPEVLRAIREIF